MSRAQVTMNVSIYQFLSNVLPSGRTSGVWNIGKSFTFEMEMGRISPF